MNKAYLYIVISFLSAQFEVDSRMLGMSGAYTTVAQGYNAIGVNPANLALDKALSINLLSLNTYAYNDFLSVKIYNDVSGADFENNGPNYFSKEDLLSYIDGDEIDIVTGLTLPLINLSFQGFGISSLNRTYLKLEIPEALFDIMLNGNTVGEKFTLGLGAEAVSANEFGVSYAKKFNFGFPFSIGLTMKYLQGLAYLRMKDVNKDGSYIMTEQTDFHGEGRYLVEQAFGGVGSAFDFGATFYDVMDDWDIGFSLINIGGSLMWSSNNPTRDLIGSTVEDILSLRQNEYMLIDFTIDTMNVMSAFNSEGDLVESNIYNVGIFSDIPMYSDASDGDLLYYTVNNLGDTVLNVTNSNIIDTLLIVDMEDGSYLVPSEKLHSSQLQSQTSQDIELDYPSFLRFGASRYIENYGVVSVDLVTGFDDSFGNSSEFRFSLGTEIIRVNKNLPIRVGLTMGGKQLSSYSLGIGFILGPIKLDIARKYYNGLIRNRAQGAEYGVNLYIDFNNFSPKELFKFNLPKFKMPKLPKLPD